MENRFPLFACLLVNDVATFSKEEVFLILRKEGSEDNVANKKMDK